MLSKTLFRAALLAGLANHSTCAVLPRHVSRLNVESAYNALQQWYHWDTGLWIPSTGWWNSANCLTVIVELAKVDNSFKDTISGVVSNTYKRAPSYSSTMVKVLGVDDSPFLMQTFYGDHWPEIPPSLASSTSGLAAQANAGFLNDYYDDEGWWALAWISAYDLTKDSRYLSQAESIFRDMNAVFGKTNCSRNSGGTGGIWWDKPHSYVNAIANELFLSVAASLANRVSSSRVNYLDIAKKQWNWFKGTGMIASNFTINDGLSQGTCKNNGGTVWSYNQGVILGGLVELSKASGDTSYLDTAHNIAQAAIATLAPNGILRDRCEPNCGADGPQFKGIFVRDLILLQQASPKPAYKTFIERNADSIWANDRNSRNQLSVRWAGPFVAPANASTQSSAMDCLVADLKLQ